MQEAERPEALFQLLLNRADGGTEEKRIAARLFAEHHRGFLSWVPAAYQDRVESALRFQSE